MLPVSVLILVALFAIQPQGTARLGRAFGPIMALWFATIALLGIWGVSRYHSVLLAIDPRHGLSYLLAGGGTGFLVLEFDSSDGARMLAGSEDPQSDG